MKRKIKYFLIVTSIFIFASCSSLLNDNQMLLNYSDDFLDVSYRIDGLDNKAFEISIDNKSDKAILLLLTEAKVLTADGNYKSIMSVSDALSNKTSIKVKNIQINPDVKYIEEFVANGYLRKQILNNEYVLLPWIDPTYFNLSIPYIVDGKKNLITITK
ncbi:MAG: hypothetical protein EOL97_10670 [Spirochaetia bacterium]|nr:hypothetical protein [Spirochaetia bacterium]